MAATQTYVAFLRAVNVGGRFIKMAALAEHVRALGHSEVQTYINSGNLIFGSTRRQTTTVADTLDRGLPPLLGFTAEAFVRTPAEVQAVAAEAAGCLPRVQGDGDVNVVFLRAPPSAEAVAAVMALRSEIDDFEVSGAHLLWLCRTRQSDSRVSNVVLERKLQQRCTLRRASMLQGLAALLARP